MAAAGSPQAASAAAVASRPRCQASSAAAASRAALAAVSSALAAFWRRIRLPPALHSAGPARQGLQAWPPGPRPRAGGPRSCPIRRGGPGPRRKGARLRPALLSAVRPARRGPRRPGAWRLRQRRRHRVRPAIFAARGRRLCRPRGRLRPAPVRRMHGRDRSRLAARAKVRFRGSRVGLAAGPAGSVRRRSRFQLCGRPRRPGCGPRSRASGRRRCQTPGAESRPGRRLRR